MKIEFNILKKIAMIFIASSCFTANAQCTKLLDFSGSVAPGFGSDPEGNLYFDGTFLYGMAQTGGINNLGVLFKIKTDGTGYDTLMSFLGTSNGKSPHGSLIAVGNYLYGETQYGGTGSAGTVFRILPNGTGYFKMYDFDGTTNGKAPFGSLVYDGTYLYGMPQVGGANNLGTIFRIKPTGVYGNGYSKLLDFTGVSGTTRAGEPEATLIYDGTYLYGTGYNGGNAGNKGAVYKLLPTGLNFDTLKTFSGVSNGSYPTSPLVSDGTYLYGTTLTGGINNIGTVFKIKPDGSGFDTLMCFRGTNGAVPHGGLYYDGTYLYGAAGGGGTNNDGILYKIKPDGSGFVNLFNFDGVLHGKGPHGDLISDGTNLYGMAVNGGTNNLGTVFKFQYCTPPPVPVITSNVAVLTSSAATGNQWYLNGNPINGATSQSYTVIQNGIYTVCTTDVNGCSSCSVQYNFSTTGISEQKQSEKINVYPNPFSSKTKIRLNMAVQNAELKVYDVLGNEVMNINNINSAEIIVPRGELNPGIYFFRLFDDKNNKFSGKFVIE